MSTNRIVTQTKITHWLPIVTFCPENNLPDLVYVSVTPKPNEFAELYWVRKEIKKLVQFKTMYMEEIARTVLEGLGDDIFMVEVELMFGKHYCSAARPIVTEIPSE